MIAWEHLPLWFVIVQVNRSRVGALIRKHNAEERCEVCLKYEPAVMGTAVERKAFLEEQHAPTGES